MVKFALTPLYLRTKAIASLLQELNNIYQFFLFGGLMYVQNLRNKIQWEQFFSVSFIGAGFRVQNYFIVEDGEQQFHFVGGWGEYMSLLIPTTRLKVEQLLCLNLSGWVCNI